MQVTKIEQRTLQGEWELTASVTSENLGTAPWPLWFRMPQSLLREPRAPSGDAFITALLPVAMACNEPLIVRGNVSEELFQSLDRIQSVYTSWDSSMSRIEVTADNVVANGVQNTDHGVGLFFSLGVDSFYSLYRSLQETASERITHLILVHGFDIPLSKEGQQAFNSAREAAAQVAQSLGLSLVCVRTNVRKFGDAFVPWGKIYHGAALASVGLATQGSLRSIRIASSYDLTNLRPWGSHPELDPLWSNGWTAFVHDSPEVSRFEKIRFISNQAAALDFLRICYQNSTKEYNCGRCNKCLMAMVSLELAGGLERCRTLPSKIDPTVFDHAIISPQQANSSFWKEILAALEKAEGMDELRDALTACLERSRQAQSPSDSSGTFAQWRDMKLSVAREVASLAGADQAVVVAGEDDLGVLQTSGLRVYAFPGRYGSYSGPPADDDEAIGELEIARDAGARYLVIDQDNFWWLDYYSGFRDYLNRNSRKILSSSTLNVFDFSDTR